MNAHIIIADIRQDVSRIREGADGQNQMVRVTRACFNAVEFILTAA